MQSTEILKALRNGTVPSKGFDFLATGIENELKELLGELEYISTGHSNARFIVGDYGAGKTFLCSAISEIAMKKDFVYSHIVVNASTNPGKFIGLYKTLLENLRTPKSGQNAGFMEILDSWSLQKFQKLMKIEGLSTTPDNVDKMSDVIRKNIELELANSKNVDPLFARAASFYAFYRLKRIQEKANLAASWLRGIEKYSNRIYNEELGLKNKLDSKDVISFLKGILLLIVEVGYKGLIVILDEIETIQRLPNRKLRNEAYETIRYILDEVGKNNFHNCLFVFACTPLMLEDKRIGFPSYEALYERISNPKRVYGESTKQTIINLKPLNQDSLIQISLKIRKLHEDAYSWKAPDRIDDEFLKKLACHFGEQFGSISSKPRDFLRSVVKFFDLVNEFPNSDPEIFLKQSIAN